MSGLGLPEIRAVLRNPSDDTEWRIEGPGWVMEPVGIVDPKLAKRLCIAAAIAMNEELKERKCDCLECRVRTAIGASSGVPLDTAAVLRTIGEVAAELLAHHTTKNAKSFVAALLLARKRFMQEPRVVIQHTQGSS